METRFLVFEGSGRSGGSGVRSFAYRSRAGELICINGRGARGPRGTVSFFLGTLRSSLGPQVRPQRRHRPLVHRSGARSRFSNRMVIQKEKKRNREFSFSSLQAANGLVGGLVDIPETLSVVGGGGGGPLWDGV